MDRRWLWLCIPAVALAAGLASALHVASNPPTIQAKDCTGVPVEDEVSCFGSRLKDAYASGGLPAANSVMEEGYRGVGMNPDRFSARCHEISHEYGKLVDISEPNLESRGPSLCRAGFFHGIHFQRFALHGTTDDLVAVAPVICVGSEDVLGIGLGGVGNGCRHALGHELLVRGVPLTSASKVCEIPSVATHNPESAASDCLYGLFMEFFLKYEGSESYIDPRPVCLDRELSPSAALACVAGAGPSLFRMAEDRTTREAFDICREFSSKLDKAIGQSCAGGVGRAAGAYLENDLDRVKDFCRQAGDLYESCLVEMAAAVFESEQDYSLVSVCSGLSIEPYCSKKMQDVIDLVGNGA